MIKAEEERGQIVYMLGNKYKECNDIIEKAITIGLKTLREKGEI